MPSTVTSVVTPPREMGLNRQGREEREGHEAKTEPFSDSSRGCIRFGSDNSLNALCGSSSEFGRFGAPDLQEVSLADAAGTNFEG